MALWRLSLLLIAMAFAAGACGGGGAQSYRIPTDSKLKPFSPPDKDELISGDADAEEGEGGRRDAKEQPKKRAATPKSPQTPKKDGAGAGQLR
jgi:hypothetical protein